MAKTKGPLTEAELLKMSEKDYMNAAQLAFFKARLTAMRDEILEKAAETVEHMREIEAVADPADRHAVDRGPGAARAAAEAVRRRLKQAPARETNKHGHLRHIWPESANPCGSRASCVFGSASCPV